MASNKLLFLTLIGAWLCQVAVAADLGQLGRIRFSTSGNAAAQEHFLAGVASLHSFGWQQARQEFLRAQELDPGFALAYWGESLTYNHPLYLPTDAEGPARALAKLAPTAQQRSARAPTPLEKGLLAAGEINAFFEGTLLEKRQAYRAALADLAARFPAHEDVKALFILSLLSEAALLPTWQRESLRQQAGTLAQELFAVNDSHPGAIHYLIHSYDDPQYATLALKAADRYAQIAPVISHARHMPTHVYLHLGRWYEVAELNETAFYTARALWRPGDPADDQVHALDFGQYGDLQLADYEAAEQWIERAEDALVQNPADPHVEALLGRLRARLIIESRRWRYEPPNPAHTADELLAIGLSAVNMRDLVVAREASRLLDEQARRGGDAAPLKIAALELQASIEFSQGETDQALATIDQAVTLTRENPATDPLPNPIKPAMEIKGEFLLRAGHLDQAIEAFRESLQITPFRPWSLLGLARSFASKGDNAQASLYYRQLLDSWDDLTLLGVSEARTHLRLHD